MRMVAPHRQRGDQPRKPERGASLKSVSALGRPAKYRVQRTLVSVGKASAFGPTGMSGTAALPAIRGAAYESIVAGIGTKAGRYL